MHAQKQRLQMDKYHQVNYVSAEMRGTTTESQQDFQLQIEIS